MLNNILKFSLPHSVKLLKDLLTTVFVGNRWEKERSIETETTASARQSETIYHSEKKMSRHKSWIYFLVLTCLFTVSRLQPHFGVLPSAKKMELVNSRLLTSSWLLFNCTSLPHHVWPLAKNSIRPLLPSIVSGQKHPSSFFLYLFNFHFLQLRYKWCDGSSIIVIVLRRILNAVFSGRVKADS